MPTTKMTMYFQLSTIDSRDQTPKRLAGWSESWYYPGNPTEAKKAANDINRVLNDRANCLPKRGTIIAQRYQQVDPLPVGSSEIDPHVYTQSQGLLSDIPQMAILVRVPGVGVRNTKNYLMRGIPDPTVITGEFTPPKEYSDALEAYFQTLSAWTFRAHDLTQPRITVVSVTALGVVTTNANHGLNPDDKVTITRSRQNNTGKLFSGQFDVIDVTDTKHFTIDPGELSETAMGGKMQKVVVIYPRVDSTNVKVLRAVTRKVGRPFDLYRGRR